MIRSEYQQAWNNWRALNRRHAHLQQKPHRNNFDKAELLALQWALDEIAKMREQLGLPPLTTALVGPREVPL